MMADKAAAILAAAHSSLWRRRPAPYRGGGALVEQTRCLVHATFAPYTAFELGSVQYRWQAQDYSASPAIDLPNFGCS